MFHLSCNQGIASTARILNLCNDIWRHAYGVVLRPCAQGFASTAQTILDTLGAKNKGPILLMHGAIQGGWVWEFPRISNGAPLVGSPPALLKYPAHNAFRPPLPCVPYPPGRLGMGGSRYLIWCTTVVVHSGPFIQSRIIGHRQRLPAHHYALPRSNMYCMFKASAISHLEPGVF